MGPVILGDMEAFMAAWTAQKQMPFIYYFVSGFFLLLSWVLLLQWRKVDWRGWMFTAETSFSQMNMVRHLQEELQEEKKRHACTEHKRLQERKGRIELEKEYRLAIAQRLNTDHGVFVQPIGVIVSCFKKSLGTPRQGSLVPSTLGEIRLHTNISPEATTCLEQFSHVWIVFIFHKNTNGRNYRAHSGVREDSKGFTFPAKISPPVLKKRVGIFSSRSPHRPNPIGVTLARIEQVQGRVVSISGLDLVDGTPVLDIKPYVPDYDCQEDTRVAAWITLGLDTKRKVTLVDPSLEEVAMDFALKSKLYRHAPSKFLKAICEVLSMDVRRTVNCRREEEFDVELPFDHVTVRYRFKPDCVQIIDLREKERDSEIENVGFCN